MEESKPAPQFGALLRRLRLAKGLTQEALADRTGVAPRTIQDLERGIGRPRRQTVDRLITVLRPGPNERAAFERATSAPRRRSLRLVTGERHTEIKGQGGPVEDWQPAASHQLRVPTPPTLFVGRERELADLGRLITTRRLLTLTGPGGCGKTRLAVELVPRLTARFPDGICFVSLAPVADPAFVASTAAEALGLPEAPGSPTIERLRRGIGQRRILLVLDNFEHLTSAAPVLAELLAACPELTLLVTSREIVRLSGEQVYSVPPLILPDLSGTPFADEGSLSALADSEAVRLFVERARSVQPGFRLTSDNAAAVAQICVRLDGLPLALELAAARIRHLTPEAICGRLEHRLGLLTMGARDLPARQQTLRDTIAWSHDLLDARERRMFRRLAVFVRGWTWDAAEGIARAEVWRDAPRSDALDVIGSLIDKSLVQHVPGSGDRPGFSMLETIREYALEQLEASGEAEDARRWHRDWFLASAEPTTDEVVGPRQAKWFRRLEAEHDNLRAALEWSTAWPGEAEPGSRLLEVLAWFWMVRGHVTEGRHRAERLVAVAPAGTVARARALGVAGYLSGLQGDAAVSQTLLEEALAIWRALGDQPGIVGTLSSLGRLAQGRGDLHQAAVLFEEGAALYRQAGADLGSWRRLATYFDSPIDGLAMLEQDRGDLDRAAALLEEWMALARQLGDQHAIGDLLRKLGALAQARGDLDHAVALLRQSLRVFRRLDDQTCTASNLERLAILAAHVGQASTAARLFGAAEATRRSTGIALHVRLQHGHAQATATARADLGDAAFAAQWAEGEAMSTVQAVDYALDDTPDPRAPAR